MTDRAPPRDPLHGTTLKEVVERLVAYYGFEALAERVPVRCFQHEPSVASSLKFLRRTPWARAKVESLYVATRGAWSARLDESEPPGDARRGSSED